MSLLRWDPFQDMERFFDETLVPRRFFRREREMESAMTFPLDVRETNNGYEVEASLPGVKPDDVDVTFSGNMLTIRGQHQEAHEEKESSYLLRERRFGTFVRSISLPADANLQQCQARFEDGVLTLDIPKKEEAKPRRIEVKARKQLSEGQQTQQS